jgi:hypothetical protein
MKKSGVLLPGNGVAVFVFGRKEKSEPRFGAISRPEKSAYDAKQKALRVAMSVIDAEIARERQFVDPRWVVLARH